jgi:hypothetical protein
LDLVGLLLGVTIDRSILGLEVQTENNSTFMDESLKDTPAKALGRARDESDLSFKTTRHNGGNLMYSVLGWKEEKKRRR